MTEKHAANSAHEAIFNAVNGAHRDPSNAFTTATAVLHALDEAGYAVVQLPEPSYVDDPEGNGEKGYGFNGPGGCVTTLAEHGVYAYGGKVYDQYDGWTPEQARTIASWWLAAANAAAPASETR